jgi:dipeptidyl aminopeptidase/acylaminoacyl peptidase
MVAALAVSPAGGGWRALSAAERSGVGLAPAGDRIAFLRAVEDVPQLHVEDLDGEARALTSVPDGIAAFAWRRDGAGLVAVAGATVGRPPHAPWSSAHDGVAADGRVGPVPRGRLVAVGLDGALRELTSGADDRAPAVSPDGAWLAFARLAPHRDGRPGADLWRMPLGGGEPEPLRTGLALAISPSWSPDGATIACFGTAEPRLGPSDPGVHAWTLPAAGGRAERVAPGLDRSVGLLPRLPAAGPGPTWLPSGEVLFAVLEAGAVHLVAADPATGAVRTVVGGERQVLRYAAGGGRVAFAMTSSLEPSAAAVVAPDGARPAERPVELVAPRRRAAAGDAELVVERRAFPAPAGGGRDGWLLRRRDLAGPAPLLVTYHGGPHGFAGPAFPAGHLHRHVLAQRGWLVLALNAVGSGSYTTAFADAIHGRWGEADLPEHLAAVDALVAAGEADPERLAVAGFSYGGYLAAWTIAHDDRFRAAVAGAPVADLRTFWATSDIGRWFVPIQMAAEPWEAPERYERLSPVAHADRVRTPLLILCGDDDARCPLGQAQQLHAAVQAAGHAECELVRYPGADHNFPSGGRPSHRLDYNRRAVEWLERWTLG